MLNSWQASSFTLISGRACGSFASGTEAWLDQVTAFLRRIKVARRGFGTGKTPAFCSPGAFWAHPPFDRTRSNEVGISSSTITLVGFMLARYRQAT